MHYKDGTEAKLGDLIKGTGYNVKNPDGTPAVVVGTLIHITPNSETCNMTIAYAKTMRVLKPDPTLASTLQPVLAGVYEPADDDGKVLVATMATEYGQLDAFELVHRP